MPVRKTLSLWIAVGMFGLSAAGTHLAYQSLCPPIAQPRTLRELSELLSQVEPDLLVIPVMADETETGVWVCERPMTWEQRSRLRRVPGDASRWQGVVLCERIGEMTQLVDTDTWGDHGMQVGSILLFGDPVLLRRIHQAILDHPEVK